MRVTTFALVSFVYGCSAVPVREEAYWDGCVTGYADAGRYKYHGFEIHDTRRYAADTQYRAGYDHGYIHCYEDELYDPWYMPGGSNM